MRDDLKRLWNSRPLTCFLILSACWVALLYHGAVSAPFVYDDFTLIQKNPTLTSWSGTLKYFLVSTSFSADFLGFSGSYYRPVTWLSFAADRKLWGLHAAGFHFTNLALTWANSALAFTILRRLGGSLALAAIAALVWLSMPVNSEAVIWISARCYSLCVFFLLWAILLAQSYCLKRRPLVLAGYFGACCLALLSHETGVLVVPLVLLLALVQQKRNSLGRALIALCLAGLTADALYMVLAHVTASSASRGITLSVLSAGSKFFRYLAWMLLPVGMSVERSTDTPANELTIGATVAFLALAGLCWLVFVIRKREPGVSGGLGWMTIALLPFCVVAVYQGMGERYEYLASLGLATAATAFVLQLKAPARRIAGWILLAWVAWGTWRVDARVSDWSNETTLYASSLRTTPRSWVLLLNLGNAYLQGGNYEEAKQAYNRALGVNPRAVKAAINLAASLQMQGDKAAAEKEYEYAISLAPTQGDIYTNLGALVFAEGNTVYAEQLLKKAVNLNASDATAYFDLGVLYERSGRNDLAIEMFEKTLQLNPDYPDAHRALDQARRK